MDDAKNNNLFLSKKKKRIELKNEVFLNSNLKQGFFKLTLSLCSKISRQRQQVELGEFQNKVILDAT